MRILVLLQYQFLFVNFAPDIISSTITTIHNWLTINSLVFNAIKTRNRQLSHITKLLNYQLHSLRLIRLSISISTATIIASAYILPLVDYCNFILYNTPSSYITKLKFFKIR